MINKFQAAAEYMYSTVTNASMVISNMIGPVEQMALANHPIKGLYYSLAGTPEVLIKKIIFDPRLVYFFICLCILLFQHLKIYIYTCMHV